MSSSRLSRTNSRISTVSRSSTPISTTSSLDSLQGVHTIDQSRAAVLSKSDLERIKAQASLSSNPTPSHKLTTEQRRQLAATKRERLQNLDKTRKPAPSTVSDDTSTQSTKSRAKLLKCEEKEEAKKLNSMAIFAKCAAVRDRQIEEKKMLQMQEEQEQARLAAVMEEERQEAIRKEREKEEAIKRQMQQGAEVIKKQKEERRLQRLMEEEALEKDKKAALEHIELLKKEEQKEAERRMKETRRLREELNNVNSELSQKKMLEMEREKEEELKILDYQRKKAEEEERRLQESKLQAQKKEEEINKLRQLQEKARDKQTEIDELRARRAMEAAERKYREKERQEAQKRKQLNDELAKARFSQLHDKEERLLTMVQQEEQEFDEIARAQKQHVEAQKKEEERLRKLYKQHQEELLAQIEERRQEYKKERENALVEGRKVLRRRAEEHAELRAMRDLKVLELEEQGVPAKYLTAMKGLKI
ncbi:hypothetical protein P9112_001740 [Eukaryota sp. TZLM1-RC]